MWSALLTVCDNTGVDIWGLAGDKSGVMGELAEQWTAEPGGVCQVGELTGDAGSGDWWSSGGVTGAGDWGTSGGITGGVLPSCTCTGDGGCCTNVTGAAL